MTNSHIQPNFVDLFPRTNGKNTSINLHIICLQKGYQAFSAYFDQAHLIKGTKRFTTKKPKVLENQTEALTMKYLMDHQELKI